MEDVYLWLVSQIRPFFRSKKATLLLEDRYGIYKMDERLESSLIGWCCCGKYF